MAFSMVLPDRSKSPLKLLILAIALIQVRCFASVGYETRKISQIASEEGDGLLLSQEEVEAQMASLRSKYPTSEADYLAAARQRSEAKVESRERQATDEDWQKMAEEKKRAFGEVDAWEDSKKESGNIDSQILMPMAEGEEGGEDEEPKLLLF